MKKHKTMCMRFTCQFISLDWDCCIIFVVTEVKSRRRVLSFTVPINLWCCLWRPTWMAPKVISYRCASNDTLLRVSLKHMLWFMRYSALQTSKYTQYTHTPHCAFNFPSWSMFIKLLFKKFTLACQFEIDWEQMYFSANNGICHKPKIISKR